MVIVNLKDLWVINTWEEDGDLGHWSPCFSRLFHDWEL